MRNALLILLVSVFGGCSQPDDLPRAELESIYGRLVLLGTPGRVEGPGERETLNAQIESLGGAARVESLLVEAMIAEPDHWKLLLDSLKVEVQK
ncbi:MAG: hypothetical protein HKN20_03285 [Gemmatimonadetes bacterium]|nr:hypothetical protein [Gemmatimonadota bacterium]